MSNDIETPELSLARANFQAWMQNRRAELITEIEIDNGYDNIGLYLNSKRGQYENSISRD
jgi:hypothetical protein